MRRTIKLVLGSGLFAIGVLFLLKNLGLIEGDLFKFWPLLLVVGGLAILGDYFFGKYASNNSSY